MRKFIFVSVLISILLLSLAGCEELPENLQATKPVAATSYPAPPQSGVPEGYPITTAGPIGAYPALASGPLFQLGKPDNSNVTFAKEDFDKLSKVKVSDGGIEYEGVKLKDVISIYQISSYTKVTVLGANGRLEIQKADLTDKWIIALSDGVVVLSQDLPKDKWMLGVNFIKVE